MHFTGLSEVESIKEMHPTQSSHTAAQPLPPSVFLWILYCFCSSTPARHCVCLFSCDCLFSLGSGCYLRLCLFIVPS